MTLIADILKTAEFCASDYPAGSPVAQAAGRILAAHHNGGLSRALLSQAAQEIESGLVTRLRQLVSETVGGD